MRPSLRASAFRWKARSVGSRPRVRRAALAAALAGVAWSSACAGAPEPKEVCLQVRASPNLNSYDGQPHVVALHLFPLETALGFEQAPAGDLLAGVMPPGVAGSPLQLTVGPGEERGVAETLPPSARQLGIVADYYREPGDAEGSRKAVVPASCGFFGTPTVVLSPRDLLVE